MNRFDDAVLSLFNNGSLSIRFSINSDRIGIESGSTRDRLGIESEPRSRSSRDRDRVSPSGERATGRALCGRVRARDTYNARARGRARSAADQSTCFGGSTPDTPSILVELTQPETGSEYSGVLEGTAHNARTDQSSAGSVPSISSPGSITS